MHLPISENIRLIAACLSTALFFIISSKRQRQHFVTETGTGRPWLPVYFDELMTRFIFLNSNKKCNWQPYKIIIICCKQKLV